MATEPEHVDPLAEQLVRVLADVAASGRRRLRAVGENSGGGPDPSMMQVVGGASVGGGLRGVLGQVPGHLFRGQCLGGVVGAAVDPYRA